MGFDYSYPFLLAKVTIQQFCQKHSRIRQLKRLYQGAFREKAKKNRKTVYLVMTPEHENMGDHAIALAEVEFFRKHGIDFVEIPDKQLEEFEKLELLDMMNGKPIVLHGGGYLGTLWEEPDTMMRKILRFNPQSPIVLMPNTIFYEDSEQGRAALENSIREYGAHPALYLNAREETSYEVMRKAYRNVKLTPDIVLSLDRSTENLPRKGCILCLRSDLERTRSEEAEASIRSQAAALFGDLVRDSDMIAEGCIAASQRKEALQRKFTEFGSAELVITDRLHGMIFCAITGTPCVVLNSKSPKVRGCHAWIRDLPYIRFVDDVGQITDAYRAIPAGPHSFDGSHLNAYFDALAQDLSRVFRWEG